MGKDRSTCNIKRSDESLFICDMQHANNQLITRYNHLIQGRITQKSKSMEGKEIEHAPRSYPLFQADPPLHCLSPKKKNSYRLHLLGCVHVQVFSRTEKVGNVFSSLQD